MEKIATKTPLQRAVLHLKGKELIATDSDIAEKLNYSKGTVSAYLSGNTRPSPEFIKKFENLFKVRISDFKKIVEEDEDENKNSTEDPQAIYPSTLNYKERYFATLEKLSRCQEELLAERQRNYR